MSDTKTHERFDEWAILELMGHRKLAGKVSEATLAGGAFIRIDVPGAEADVATQFYSPNAVYCITPTTEDVARRFAAGCRPHPVSRWELAGLPEEASSPSRELDDPDLDEEIDRQDGF